MTNNQHDGNNEEDKEEEGKEYIFPVSLFAICGYGPTLEDAWEDACEYMKWDDFIEEFDLNDAVVAGKGDRQEEAWQLPGWLRPAFLEGNCATVGEFEQTVLAALQRMNGDALSRLDSGEELTEGDKSASRD